MFNHVNIDLPSLNKETIDGVRYSMSVVPLVFGLPVLFMIPFMRKHYLKEIEDMESKQSI